MNTAFVIASISAHIFLLYKLYNIKNNQPKNDDEEIDERWLGL